MTRAARSRVLQYLMKGASNPRTYFGKKRRNTLASRPRPVAGLNPGSTALKCSRGVSPAGLKRAEVALLGRGVGVAAWQLGAPRLPLAARARLRRDVATAAEAGHLGGSALRIFDAGGHENHLAPLGRWGTRASVSAN